MNGGRRSRMAGEADFLTKRATVRLSHAGSAATIFQTGFEQRAYHFAAS